MAGAGMVARMVGRSGKLVTYWSIPRAQGLVLGYDLSRITLEQLRTLRELIALSQDGRGADD